MKFLDYQLVLLIVYTDFQLSYENDMNFIIYKSQQANNFISYDHKTYHLQLLTIIANYFKGILCFNNMSYIIFTYDIMKGANPFLKKTQKNYWPFYAHYHFCGNL